DAAELLEALDALAQSKSAPNLVSSRKTSGPLAFLFSGQGSQRPEMGADLYEAFPLYAEAFDQACDALESELGFSVKEAVFAEQGSELATSLSRTDLTQASLFALQVALFRLVSSFGLKPDHLLGHSIGEISAAHLAGVLSLDDAAKLVAARGRLMAALPSGGAMASIRATEHEVEESLASFEGRLNIAAINAPASITVSGDEDALDQWEAQVSEAGKKVKRLEVSHAFHSHRMEPMLSEFEEVASSLDFNAPQIPVISNLTGEPLTEEQATSPSYWASHVRKAVRFADGVAYLRSQGTSACLELGPDAILTAIAAEVLEAGEGTKPALAASLRRERFEPQSFLLGLGALHAAGTEVDFSPIFDGTGAAFTQLPTYPFQRQRYWLEATAGAGAGDASALGQSSAEHPMLGAAISLADEEAVLTGRISQKTHPWLADHGVAGTPIMPGTGFVELALRAGREVGAGHLQELVLEMPLPIPAAGGVQLQVSVTPEEGTDAQRVLIFSRAEAVAAGEGEEEAEPLWIRHASGTLTAREPGPQAFDATAWPPAGAEPIDTAAFYDLLADAGADYGPAFQGLEAAWKLGADAYAEVSLAEEEASEAGRFGIHPALLDAALHPTFFNVDRSQGVVLPFSFAGVSLHEAEGAAALRVRVRMDERGRIALAAADRDGNP
ncbi:MAG TPA: acyltransferase domain-containing protein, partial [Vicinamibacteria bacterium]